jgi:hypothetical protein
MEGHVVDKMFAASPRVSTPIQDNRAVLLPAGGDGSGFLARLCGAATSAVQEGEQSGLLRPSASFCTTTFLNALLIL